jgi:hypothetical protein
MRLQKDLREFIALSNSNKVEYVMQERSPSLSTAARGTPAISTSSSDRRPPTQLNWSGPYPSLASPLPAYAPQILSRLTR